jgi:ADP-ribose pyrophosphatase YjhB (NUDIX family)
LVQTERKLVLAFQDNISLSLAADIVLLTSADEENDNIRKLPEKHLEVLLVKRGKKPFVNQWALPGGFVEDSETAKEAALRELEEETGTNNAYLEQLHFFSDPNRDPRKRVVSCAYLSTAIKTQVKPNLDSDAIESKWFSLESYRQESNNLLEMVLVNDSLKIEAEVQMGDDEPRIVKNSGLAFDHAKIIVYAIESLKRKLDTTDTIFRMLPEEFTLAEAQKLYEVLYDKHVHPTAFRRKILRDIKLVDSKTRHVGYRPAALYRKQ